MLKFFRYCVLSNLLGAVAYADENHCTVIKGPTYGYTDIGNPYSDLAKLSQLADWKTLRIATIDVCDGTQPS